MDREVTLEEMKQTIGEKVFVSDWKTITQDQINTFAKATHDFQWIHVDIQKADNGPFGKPIAHGFLTLSLLSSFSFQGAPVPKGTKMSTNYGLNKVRFITPVKVDDEIRDHIVLQDVIVKKPGQVLITTRHTIEIKGESKPACVAEFLTLSFL